MAIIIILLVHDHIQSLILRRLWIHETFEDDIPKDTEEIILDEAEIYSKGGDSNIYLFVRNDTDDNTDDKISSSIVTIYSKENDSNKAKLLMKKEIFKIFGRDNIHISDCRDTDKKKTSCVEIHLLDKIDNGGGYPELSEYQQLDKFTDEIGKEYPDEFDHLKEEHECTDATNCQYDILDDVKQLETTREKRRLFSKELESHHLIYRTNTQTEPELKNSDLNYARIGLKETANVYEVNVGRFSRPLPEYRTFPEIKYTPIAEDHHSLVSRS